jgi:hypothetical protein
LEDPVHGDKNPFTTFTSPAGILAYVYTALSPKVVTEVLAGVIDAGAGRLSLFQDMTALMEMGHEQPAELVFEAAGGEDGLNRVNEAVNEAVKGDHLFIFGKSITETDFMPESMENAGEIVLKAVAAITGMKVRQRCDGVSIYEWEN